MRHIKNHIKNLKLEISKNLKEHYKNNKHNSDFSECYQSESAFLKSYELWKTDKTYDFESQKVQELDEIVTDIELLIKESKKLNAIFQTIGFIRDAINGQS